MQRRRERAAKASWLEQTRQEASETSTERGGLSCECVCVCVAKGNNARSRRAGTRKEPRHKANRQEGKKRRRLWRNDERPVRGQDESRTSTRILR